MDQAVVLVPLTCLKCQAALPAEPGQVAWVCATCGQALYLNDESGLELLELYYAAGIPENGVGRPCWVSDGQVTLQRETFGTAKSSVEAQQYWSGLRRFFIPADLPALEEMLSQAVQWMAQPPRLEASQPANFRPVTLEMKDVVAAAEFIVVAIEAGRADRLKKIDFQLKLSRPVLWILPA